MKKIFKIDDASKIKLIAANYLYELSNKDKLVVEYSYKQDDFNIYAFSDNLHIGIKTVGDVIHQKIMNLNQDTRITREYASLESAMIETINDEFTLKTKEDSLKNIHTLINSGILEYINRNGIYQRYIQTKHRQVELIKVDLIKRIEEENDVIKRIMDRKLLFKLNWNEPEEVELQISAKGYNDGTRSILEWSFTRNLENLNIILGSAHFLWRSSEIKQAIFKYIVIICYYKGEEEFNKLFRNTERTNNEIGAGGALISLFERTSFDSSRTIGKPINECYSMRNYNNDANPITDFDYANITNLEHLQIVIDLYNLLVLRHKKYVTAGIKDVEQYIFGLQRHLPGSKETKHILNQLMQIDTLNARINELTAQGIIDEGPDF